MIIGALTIWMYLIVLNIVFFFIFALLLLFWVYFVDVIDNEVYDTFSDSYYALKEYGVSLNTIKSTPFGIIIVVLLPVYPIIKMSAFLTDMLLYGLQGAANISAMNQMRDLDVAVATKEEMISMLELERDSQDSQEEIKDTNARDK